MFGNNQIVGKKFFENAKEDELLITSMFTTLQGEGPFRGEPAFFIRTAMCNLSCNFCDTFFDKGDWLSFNEIEKRIEDNLDTTYKNFDVIRPRWTYHNQVDRKKMVLVLTGGEPSLQKNLSPFLDQMKGVFYKAQIESNGTNLLDYPDKFLTYVVSPKCLEKDRKAVRYLEPNKDVLARADCLKFVMSADKNSPYSEVPEWALEWRNRTGKEVFVSPMNIYKHEPQKSKKLRAEKENITLEERSTVDEKVSFWEEGLLDMKQNQLNHEYAAQYCMKHGLTLNLQVHLYASLA